eukprot:gene25148-31570_t
MVYVVRSHLHKDSSIISSSEEQERDLGKRMVSVWVDDDFVDEQNFNSIKNIIKDLDERHLNQIYRELTESLGRQEVEHTMQPEQTIFFIAREMNKHHNLM